MAGTRGIQAILLLDIRPTEPARSTHRTNGTSRHWSPHGSALRRLITYHLVRCGEAGWKATRSSNA